MHEAPFFLTSSLKNTYFITFDKQYFVSLCHLILCDTKGVLTMFIRKKIYPSGNIGVIVVEKIGGKIKELATIGVAYSEDEVENLVNEAKEWISKEESRRHPQLDLYGEDREACDREREEVRRVLSNVSNILLNGCDLILDRTFDRIGFNRIDDDVFRKLVKARLAYPTSKAATVDIPIQDVYAAYHNLWHVERAFRIAKSKIEIRPMFHFTRKRIKAHICICFVALKVYKELERMLKVSEIKMSVDKVLALAKTITTIQIKLPLNKEVYTQTMLMARHQKNRETL